MSNERSPLNEAIHLYNKFNTMYLLNTPAEIRMARRIACHSAQVHIDIMRNPKMSTDELTFWALVYNELETIKKSI